MLFKIDNVQNGLTIRPECFVLITEPNKADTALFVEVGSDRIRGNKCITRREVSIRY